MCVDRFHIVSLFLSNPCTTGTLSKEACVYFVCATEIPQPPSRGNIIVGACTYSVHTKARFNPDMCALEGVGLGICRTDADSQRNSVYTAFHRFFCCGNETIRW